MLRVDAFALIMRIVLFTQPSDLLLRWSRKIAGKCTGVGMWNAINGDNSVVRGGADARSDKCESCVEPRLNLGLEDRKIVTPMPGTANSFAVTHVSSAKNVYARVTVKESELGTYGMIFSELVRLDSGEFMSSIDFSLSLRCCVLKKRRSDQVVVELE